MLSSQEVPSTERMTVTFDNRNPIELADLTLSLFAMADEYKRFVAGRGVNPTEEVKLYVNQLRSGSIIVELAPIAAAVGLPYIQSVLPFLQDKESVVEFAKHLDSAFSFLTGKKEKPDEPLEKANLKNLNAIVEPTAKDPGSSMSIATFDGANIGAPVTVNINIGSLEANAAQNAIKRELENLGQSVSGFHGGVLLYWHQTKNDPRSNAGDKAIIERLSMSPVKVSFASPQIKESMIHGDKNPFTMGFLVDVDVQTVRGKPAVYNILALKEVVDLSSDDSQTSMFDDPPQLPPTSNQ